ncbi:FecR domain-containing protein [Myxococcus landrumensis]|uniref:FecR domain-containing protein n=1 Tax=Myxococcus landrumensis TaxID=2813577 RepID=A0ABX7NM23_9BACT|nr:FecR domain-containing protein [Myxococcus landrumus]QSQ17303.1 FecR domain-containing protein [Myxococcus landrumus]
MAHLETRALWALAANESSAEETTRAQAHLGQCAKCTEELERVRTTRAMLQEARAEQPSVPWDALGTKLRSQAAARLAADASRWRWPRMPVVQWPWGLALAGAVAAMVAFWVAIPREPSTQASPADTMIAEQRPTASGAQVAETGATSSRDSDTAHAESTTGAMLKERGGELRELRAGMRLGSGTAVQTPARASAMLRLPDASRAKLSAESEVELSRAEARDVHLTVRQGRLSVKASHTERRGFRVDVADLRVWVVGTVFTVERTAEGASVAVAEGRVRVESDGRPPRMVGAGERIELRERDRDLKQEPLSGADREALDAVNQAPEPALPEAGLTVPTAANTPESAQAVRPAVAHAPSTVKPALATTPSTQPEPRSKVMSASMAMKHDKPQSPSSSAPRAAPETTVPEEPRPTTAVAKAGSPSTPSGNPEQEFAPYPAPSVAESLPPPPVSNAPAVPPPAPPVQVAQTPPPKRKSEGLIPMSLLSKDSDERFLGYARLQMGPRTCENFLAGLEEIADRSPRTDHREQARYLRARCFEERLQGQDAKMEYRQYLNEFPRGRYVREAGAAILP